MFYRDERAAGGMFVTGDRLRSIRPAQPCLEQRPRALVNAKIKRREPKVSFWTYDRAVLVSERDRLAALGGNAPPVTTVRITEQSK
jgi:hypothetical protein